MCERPRGAEEPRPRSCRSPRGWGHRGGPRKTRGGGDSEAAPGIWAAFPEQGEERQRREGARDTREGEKEKGKKKEKNKEKKKREENKEK